MINIYKLTAADILEIIIPAAQEGIAYWRSGDKRRGRDIIGSVVYESLVSRGVSVRLIGELFSLAVERGELPLKFLKMDSSNYNVYILKN